MDFDLPRDRLKIIKVIGVGGGGGNAVTHMYHEGIHDVSFLLCNTDEQALKPSDVPDKLVLGDGLGAGGKPEKAKVAAQASETDIRRKLSDGTKMVFITAGMGGGTGTGAAPLIAQYARDMGILTVGIVTIPFKWEGEPKILMALRGVEAIRKSVDALLVINNERLFDVNAADVDTETVFAKADETLTVAAKSIAEIITVPGIINLDFADVDTTLRNGGVALMSIGYGKGEGRFHMAVEEALNSPLLNNNDVSNAKRILFNISYSEEAKLLIGELKEVRNFMSRFDTSKIEVIWGLSKDDTLGKKVKITLLATGFGINEKDKEKDNAREEEDKRLLDEFYGKNRNTQKDSSRNKVSAGSQSGIKKSGKPERKEDDGTEGKGMNWIKIMEELAIKLFDDGGNAVRMKEKEDINNIIKPE
jgi:cell division protein FtsZ